MKVTAKRAFFRAEDMLERTLSRLHLRYSSLVAKNWLRDKHQLRGHSCHCPPNLPVHLVHSEGLREGADVVVDFGANARCPRRRQIPVPALARIAGQIGDGDIVHVKSELMGAFVEHVVPRISGAIVLVSGDSDFSPVGAFKHLLEDARILHWFAQNCDVPFRHPRLTRIPIGIDNPRYHKLEKRIGFLVEMALRKTRFEPSATRNELGDQQLLQQIALNGPRDPREKPLKALCTFHMNQKVVPNFETIPDRLEAYQILRDAPCCHFVTRRVPQAKCWAMHADFAFEISPRGNGLDCFRTWECLFLGTIPIVKSSALDPLYIDEGFPVVIVDSFRQVTAQNLARWRDELAPRFTPEMYAKLTNGYWLERIRRAKRQGRCHERS